jgi:4-amino-4-deoxy-L-arabinose transferase-like glycosyltransferase
LSPSRVEALKHWFRERIARTSVAGIALWGFAVRVAAIFLMHTYRIRTSEDNFAFGYETGRVARSIVLGQGFSNPFHGITGPTAWEAPLYPYVVAGAFRVAGIYTRLSAVLLLTFNSFFSALTVVPVYLIAKKVFGPRVARWAAWTWALLPYAMNWAIRWVWETSLTAFLLTTAFWLALEIGDAREPRRKRLWLCFGLVWGIAALTNPSCLAFLPFAGGWACYRLWRQDKPWLVMATAAALVFFALITPWELRNYRVFHQFIPIRANGGAELRLGNGPGAMGIWMMGLHPSQHLLQLQLYREMGEVAYVKMRQQEALDWMRAHPGSTAVLWLKKAIYYWAGVPNPSANWLPVQGKNSVFLAWSVLAWWGLGRMIRLRHQGAFLFAALLLAYPAIYYVTFTLVRYRHPIEPVMLILAVYVISEARELRESGAAADAPGAAVR